MFGMMVIAEDGIEFVIFPDRASAELALLCFAEIANLDVHMHPGEYSDSALSTAYIKGGDYFLQAVASVRPLI